jgi:hypothetical protein
MASVDDSIDEASPTLVQAGSDVEGDLPRRNLSAKERRENELAHAKAEL